MPSITPHLTAQWFGETLRPPSMTHPQTLFSSKCVYFEILNVKHYIGMELNSEAFEGPTASIWTDFHLIEWAHLKGSDTRRNGLFSVNQGP